MSRVIRVKQNRVLENFLNGDSAEDICRCNDITPLELVELFKSKAMEFPNDLFELPPVDEQKQFLHIQDENIQLKNENTELVRQIKEYEIEIRIHKEVLNTLLIKK